MPAKKFKCTICGEEVSRPQSYSVVELGIGETGRACRTHKEVQEAVQAKEEEKERKRVEAEISYELGIVMLVERIRAEEWMRNAKYSLLCYENLKRQNFLSDGDVEEIKKRVEELGPLSTIEVVASMAAVAQVI